MMVTVRNLCKIADEILEAEWEITDYEALSIAVKLQNNMVLQEAFLVGMNEPCALEAIVMAMRDNNKILMEK